MYKSIKKRDGRIRTFKPEKIEAALTIAGKKTGDFNEKTAKIEDQKKELEKAIPLLENYIQKEDSKAVLYKGLKAIKNLYRAILEELKSGEEYYVIGVNYGINLPGVREFFENYHKQRAKKGIKVKMLVNQDAKDLLVKSIYSKSKIRFLPKYLMNNMIILFYKNKSFVFFLAKDSIALVIENKEVSKGFKSYFDAFWKLAKP